MYTYCIYNIVGLEILPFFPIYNNDNTLRLATELPDPELRRTLWVRGSIELVN